MEGLPDIWEHLPQGSEERRGRWSMRKEGGGGVQEEVRNGEEGFKIHIWLVNSSCVERFVYTLKPLLEIHTILTYKFNTINCFSTYIHM